MARRTAATRCRTLAQPSSCSRARSTASTWPRIRRTRFSSLVFSRVVWVMLYYTPPTYRAEAQNGQWLAGHGPRACGNSLVRHFPSDLLALARPRQDTDPNRELAFLG